MNTQHLRAFLWLRWRLRINQLKRGGTANAVILAIVAVVAVALAGASFVACLLIGLFALPQASPLVILYVWDGLIVAFLFFCTIGLLAELQRSEALSLEKFLHLPVSLTGVFLLNYVSSLLSFNLLVFLPAMAGLTLSLVFAKGPMMLFGWPLLAAFLFMVTALTNHFQGWLASLMINKRRRRTVIVLVTAVFVLVFQLPNLINVVQPWKARQRDEAAASLESAQSERADEQRWQDLGRTTTLVNALLPPGWLPLGAMSLVNGNVVPPLLGTLGFTLIGTASLWRSYRTTLRLYTGYFSSGRSRPAASAAPRAKTRQHATPLLERRLPWVSEHASIVALASYRALTRAPEAKMMLLGPVILFFAFGSMTLTRRAEPPPGMRPLMAVGAMGMTMLTMIQLAGNLFGFDRNGFRVFVLCPASRRDILLGKNLALAPLGLGLGAAALALLQVVYAMRLDYFFAALVQLLSMYLLFSLFANWLSILVPMRIASGSLKPANPKILPVLLHVGFVLVFLPLALAPTLLPLGVELLSELSGWGKGLPICLVLSIIECAALAYVYRAVLSWQGGLLQSRELKILETVTTREE